VDEFGALVGPRSLSIPVPTYTADRRLDLPVRALPIDARSSAGSPGCLAAGADGVEFLQLLLRPRIGAAAGPVVSPALGELRSLLPAFAEPKDPHAHLRLVAGRGRRRGFRFP